MSSLYFKNFTNLLILFIIIKYKIQKNGLTLITVRVLAVFK
jgi:hypothetical protein